jgi:hypothetical protein
LLRKFFFKSLSHFLSYFTTFVADKDTAFVADKKREMKRDLAEIK